MIPMPKPPRFDQARIHPEKPTLVEYQRWASREIHSTVKDAHRVLKAALVGEVEAVAADRQRHRVDRIAVAEADDRDIGVAQLPAVASCDGTGKGCVCVVIGGAEIDGLADGEITETQDAAGVSERHDLDCAT